MIAKYHLCTYNKRALYKMVLNNYRHLLPKFINGPVNFCAKHKITPNMISFLGFLDSVAAAVALALPAIFMYNYSPITANFNWWWACIPGWLFFFTGYIDVIDGAVARKIGKSSNFGAFLDSTLDRISDAVVVLGFMLSGMLWPQNTLVNNMLGFTTLIIVLMISYTRSRAELEGVVMKGIGFMERAERWFFILFSIIIEWIAFAIQVQFMDIDPANVFHIFPYLHILYTVLCFQTLWSRVSWAFKWLNNKMPEKVAKILAKQETLAK
ncbi:hypothetical protein WKT22_01470 [Candidatus Lokiarchaeum ossiferum]